MRRCLPNQIVQMEASRWLELQVLLDPAELCQLFQEIEEAFSSPLFFRTGAVVSINQGALLAADFQKIYTQYVEGLQQGRAISEQQFRSLFSSVLTLTDEVLVAIDLGKGEELLRVERPAIQLQWLKIYFSEESGNFYPMAKGLDMISWGLQFSYPQLFWDPNKQEGCKVDDSAQFPNTALFKFIQRWLRHHSIPTPFCFAGQVKNVPMRLGKKCFSWISAHPDLQRKGIQVKLPDTKTF